jgi:UPF0271 protein
MKPDLNCDLGEGEPLSRTRALMRWITSANIACGGHAGSPASMDACVRLAKTGKVRIGAHPGFQDQAHFGRRYLPTTPSQLELLLLHQIGALESIAKNHGATLRHVKLHGALYHATEKEPALGQAYVRAIEKWWPHLVIYALASGRVARAARQLKLLVLEEVFLDRTYLDAQTLAPREIQGAVLSQPGQVKARIHSLKKTGVLHTLGGAPIRLNAQTLCIHSDTPRAVQLARIARAT